ncbi:putative proteasome inhibitor isoform X1 [Iris pallida]|uniref:Proteasome inhibitor isoform X1 n=1 Tax=Iris pallida TaxID=29817 RepID=A0AAX6E979_IRIPA|nr:putative proteasome inhibitor isoform X1 [Iris pallida]
MATEESVMAIIRASRPSFRSPSDKVAFAVHAAFMAAGYSLVATGKNAFAEHLPTDGEEVGTEGWNELDDSYGFVYSKSENGSNKLVLVKCLAIGDALVVDVLNMKEENKEPLHLQINVKDHTSDGKSNYREMFKNLKGLLENLNAGVIKQLDPVVKSASPSTGADISERRKSNVPAESSAGRQDLREGIVYPPIPSPGYSDLLPGAGAGVFPTRLPGSGGGMLIGPNDPSWFDRGEIPAHGRIPGVPPGARFDPYGPPGVPGFEPERFIRHPRRPGGGTHPDLEQLQGPDYI